MIKKTLQYTSIDGRKVSVDEYFHLFPQDLADMLQDGIYDKLMAMQDLIKDIQRKNENHDAISESETMAFTSKCTELFRYFVEKSYGRRVEDENGNADFEKDPDRTKRFMNSSAYGALYMEFIADPESGFNFINDLIPQDAIDALRQKADAKGIAVPQANYPVSPNVQTSAAPIPTMYTAQNPGGQIQQNPGGQIQYR